MIRSQQQNLELIRVALRKEFIDRCRRNPAYSLRGFAKYLEIDQSFLSKLLHGYRAITPALAHLMGPKLGISLTKIKEVTSKGTATMAGFLSISDDEFELLSEWHHFAILELAKTKDFNPSPSQIAKRLGLHVEEVRQALTRLERLGFIRVTGHRFKLLSPNTTWTNTKRSSVARKYHQRKLLEKALDAIDHVPFELRENGSLTVAVRKARLPEFKEALKEVRRQLAEQFQGENDRDMDEVYQLTISFFPLTKRATGDKL